MAGGITRIARDRTVASVEEMGGGDWEFILFLAIATAGNLWFVWTAARATYRERGPRRSKAGALFSLALADLCWSLPCLIQCAGHYANGNYWGGDPGCDFQGFYAAFTSYSTMFLTPYLAYLAAVQTARGEGQLPSAVQTARVAVAVFALAALWACIPFMAGIDGYVYLSEGFCFIDWYSSTLSALWLVLFFPTQAAMALFSFRVYRAARAADPAGSVAACGRRGGEADGVGPSVGRAYLAYALIFLVLYVLGIPLSIIGFQGVAYPDRLNIASGILAHGAELINPLMYGYFYMRWFNGSAGGETKACGAPPTRVGPDDAGVKPSAPAVLPRPTRAVVSSIV